MLGQSGDVAARPGQACDEAGLDRVGDLREDDRDLARRGLQHGQRNRATDKNHLRFQSHQLRRVRSHALGAAGRKAILDPDIAALRPTQLLEPLPERRGACLPLRIALGERHQHADAPNAVALLRARGERPKHRSAAAAPPSSVMNARRRMTELSLS